jgi:FkbM family methyltransferase
MKELIRNYFIIFKNSWHNPTFTAGALLFLVSNYTFQTLLSKKTRLVSLTSKFTDKIFIRTHSSDLKVFIQHFIYQELKEKQLKTSSDPKLILDAGANTGFTALVLHQLFPSAHIIAVELEENNFQLLAKNCQRVIQNKEMTVLQGAFYPHQMPLFIEKMNQEWSYFVSSDPNHTQQKAVEVYTYQDIIAVLNKKPDFIKMDIEGSELVFFNNDDWCENVLKNTILAVELHTFEAYSQYFYQLRKNNIMKAEQMGEYWLTKPN